MSLLVVSPRGASAESIVSTPEGEIVTTGYWIEGDSLYLVDSPEPVRLSDVQSISVNAQTALEVQMNKDALKRFYRNTAWLLQEGQELRERQQQNLECMEVIDALRSSEGSGAGLKKAVKACQAQLEDLEDGISRLISRWDHSRIPERSLVQAREIKSLELLCLKSSVQQARRYLRTWDPTYREYAREQYRQALSFEGIFSESIDDQPPAS